MMKMYKNFKQTNACALSEKQREIKHKVGVSYINDENGNDWYELQKTFQPETFKVVFEPEKNIVVALSNDASALFPLNCSIVELESLPDEAKANAEWVFDGNQVVPRTYTHAEQRQQIMRKKEKLMDKATRVIAPLQDAADLGIATEAEKSALLAWKKYRVRLNRVDISNGEWPALPE